MFSVSLQQLKVATMNNEELIEYGLNHGDRIVRDMAAQFKEYREVVSRFVGSREPIEVSIAAKVALNSRYGKFGGPQTSGERWPMYAQKY